jgi:hypothetical protein
MRQLSVAFYIYMLKNLTNFIVRTRQILKFYSHFGHVRIIIHHRPLAISY